MIKTINCRPALIKNVAFSVVLALASSCNVHEPWPETPPTPPVISDVPITLNLVFDTDLPLHKEVGYTRAGQSEHDMRYTVQVFTPARVSDSEPYITWIFTSPASTSPDFSTEVSLPEGEYEFYVWADYIDSETISDKYYDTSAWQTITVTQLDNYQGSNEYQDAFRGFAKKSINSSETTEFNTVSIQMHRPFARYEFIATDFNQFAQNQIESRAQDSSNSQNDISPDDYTVVFYYRDFTPMGYNVYTDKPNDAMTGLKYQSRITESEKGISLGFDYIFVNGTESSVKLVLGIYDSQGKLVSSTSEVEVPLARSKNTIVKGEFFSGKAQGGVGINPDFNGSYDIEI